MLTVYKHPNKPGYIVAQYHYQDGFTREIEAELSAIPGYPDKSLVRQWLIDQLTIDLPEQTIFPLELSDVDEKEEFRPDLESFVTSINAELTWLDTTITNWPTMTNVQKDAAMLRVLREQREELRAWRFTVRNLR